MSRDGLNGCKAISDNDRLDEIKRRAKEAGVPAGLTERINFKNRAYLPTVQKQHVPQNLPPAAVHTLVPPSARPATSQPGQIADRRASTATFMPDRPVATAPVVPGRPLPAVLPGANRPVSTVTLADRPRGSIGGAGANTAPIALVDPAQKAESMVGQLGTCPLQERLRADGRSSDFGEAQRKQLSLERAH
ncbi:hypothetical protein RvY_06949-3 [Ramazzottius varieornatus]|uniref:Uncharacterized protein n=1 Tax=Ramazzottius varieornatus TaxID=947166 RepID=A0A1D1V0P8_RAMVA|nr:hypothetical protein RvY_06949-3 [Ramazzottius varieornatus]